MFYVSGVQRIFPYAPGQNWRQAQPPEPSPESDEDDEGHHPQDQEHEKGDNLAQYIAPIGKSDRKIHASLLAKSVMKTSVVTLDPKTSIDEARKIFRQHRFRNLPVVSEEGTVLGMVSDTDLYEQKDKKVEEVMAESVLCADSETHIDQIAQVLFDENVKVLPILDKEKRMVGILTRSDIMRTVLKIGVIKKRLHPDSG